VRIARRRAFVAQREAAELRVVDEALDTDGCGGLDERDDLLPALGELGRLAGLAPGRLVEVVEERLPAPSAHLGDAGAGERTGSVTSSAMVWMCMTAE
jgi:hypothetical protein